MTRIRATCPTCGEVDLQPTDVELQIVRLQEDDDHEVRDGSSYQFCCPSCEDLVTKPADARIARLLTTGGVEVRVVGDLQVDVRPPHPEGLVEGAALSWDDLIDFHFQLENMDLVEAAARGVVRH